MPRRRSRRDGEHTYKAIGRSLADSAARAHFEPALRALMLEVEQFHHTAYPDCDGGCPAHAALALARAALGEEA